MLNPVNHQICFATPHRIVPSAWYEHIPFAMFLVSVLRPKMIVELGTHFGMSYCAFCQAVKELGLDTRCYAVDTWEGDTHSGLYGPEVLAGLRAHNAFFYESFSRLIQSTFDQALEHFGDGTIDLLHIDGYHAYEAVKHDFESWLPKMSATGVVLLHDINVREGDFGVRRFWDEIQSSYRHFEFIHGHGLGVLAVGHVISADFEEFLNATDDQMVTIRDFFFHLGNRLTLRLADEDKAHTLSQQSDLLEQQREALDSLRADIDRYQQLTAALEQKTESLSAQMKEKDQAFGSVSRHLERQQQAMQYLSTQLEEKEQRVQVLSAQVSEKENLAASRSPQRKGTERKQTKGRGLRESVARWIGRRSS